MTATQVAVAIALVLLMWGLFALLRWPLISLPGFIAIFAVFAAVQVAGASILALAVAAAGLLILLAVIGFALRYDPRLPGTGKAPGSEDNQAGHDRPE